MRCVDAAARARSRTSRSRPGRTNGAPAGWARRACGVGDVHGGAPSDVTVSEDRVELGDLPVSVNVDRPARRRRRGGCTLRRAASAGAVLRSSRSTTRSHRLGCTPTRCIPVSIFRWTGGLRASAATSASTFDGAHRRGQLVLDDRPPPARGLLAEHEDRGLDARLAELDALLHERDAQTVLRRRRAPPRATPPRRGRTPSALTTAHTLRGPTDASAPVHVVGDGIEIDCRPRPPLTGRGATRHLSHHDLPILRDADRGRSPAMNPRRDRAMPPRPWTHAPAPPRAAAGDRVRSGAPMIPDRTSPLSRPWRDARRPS